MTSSLDRGNSQASYSGPRRVVLTGGNGYLGSELIRQLLATGADVQVIAHTNDEKLLALLPPENIHHIATDFAAVAQLVQAYQPDSIFHLAAIHAEPPSFDDMMNMVGCSMMLGTALLHGAAQSERRPVFLHAGTYWQFDRDVFAPNTFYAAAKQALHDFLAYYRRAQGIASVTLVLYDIYGPADTRPKLWSKLAAAPPGSSFPLTEGRQLVELVHVADMARAFLVAAQSLISGATLEPFHAVRSGVRITLRELLEQVQSRTGLDLRFEWGVIPYWPGQIFEPWQGTLLPGWRPSVAPVDGIIAVLQEAMASRADVS